MISATTYKKTRLSPCYKYSRTSGFFSISFFPIQLNNCSNQTSSFLNLFHKFCLLHDFPESKDPGIIRLKNEILHIFLHFWQWESMDFFQDTFFKLLRCSNMKFFEDFPVRFLIISRDKTNIIHISSFVSVQKSIDFHR